MNSVVLAVPGCDTKTGVALPYSSVRTEPHIIAAQSCSVEKTARITQISIPAWISPSHTLSRISRNTGMRRKMTKQMDRSMHTRAACCGNCKFSVRASSLFEAVCCNLDHTRLLDGVEGLTAWEISHDVLPTTVCPFFEAGQ